MALKGSLETLSITSVFQFVAGRGDTGSVWVSGKNRELFIYFENGSIRLLATGREENYRLDSYLIKFVRALPKDIRDCADKAEADGVRPETAFIEAGYATQDDLNAAVRLWIEEQIFDISEWKVGQFKFIPDYKPQAKTDDIQKNCSVDIPLNDLLLTLVQRQSEWQKLLDRFPDDNVIFEITSISREDLGSCTVPASWLAEAHLINGAHTIAEIAQKTILTKFELYQLLSDLHYRGLIVNARKENLVKLGKEAQKKGDLEGVIKFFENALNSAPNDVEVRRQYARILKKMGRKKRASEHFRILGDHFIEGDNLENAMQSYNAALTLVPDSTVALRHMADLHEQKGDLNKALEIRARIGELYRKTGRSMDAALVYEYLSEKLPDEILWCLMAADCYGDLDMPDEAAEFYEKAIGTVLDQDRKDRIQEIINSAMTRFPGNPLLERRLLASVKKHKAKKEKNGPEKD
ncbi:MAG: DUF4388 domain-containing protein [Planctomycetota bacterium]